MADQQLFTIILQPVEEGGFNVIVPALPEVSTFGATKDEAVAMAEDAIRLAISYRLDHDEEIPPAGLAEVREVTVAV
ncbi:MAG: type II toxin-antitoxin system HicB family antitoxin [Geminicoccaceae bacterium]|nr:type II toxin-antitoxin system HicB family antitoxin [Geminicoccaceae bacterium]